MIHLSQNHLRKKWAYGFGYGLGYGFGYDFDYGFRYGLGYGLGFRKDPQKIFSDSVFRVGNSGIHFREEIWVREPSQPRP